MMALFSGVFTANNASNNPSEKDKNGLFKYIFFTGAQGEETLSYKPITEGVKTYGQYFILLNTLVPISLIVTLEFVKLF